MGTPLVSILLPTYNGARYIREAIDSVLAQNFSDFELIIIDDASVDGVSLIIEEYLAKDARVVSYRNDKNMKLVTTLNVGLQVARGQYIARIDDDDIWNSREKLQKQVEILECSPRVAIVGTFGYIIDEESKRTGQCIMHHTDAGSVRKGFGLKNELIHTSILARKSILMEAGGYRKEWLYVEDFDLWLRVLSLGYEIINIPEYLIEYRVRKGSTTGKKYHRMQGLTFRRLLIEKGVYTNRLHRYLSISIRFLLWITPMWIIGIVKK